MDCYQAACSLLAQPKLDVNAMAELTGKWGRGGRLGGQSVRWRSLLSGAVAAVGSCQPLVVAADLCLCSFELRAIKMFYVNDILRLNWQVFMMNFCKISASAEALYLDFSQFLLRQMIKFYEKTLL